MAQIIKHRRGSIDSVVATSAKKGELIMATGSIGNMNGPWIFIGHTDGVNGGYNTVSKIYQGTAAPTIDVGSYGSTIDGTPFYATGNKTLYVLNKDGNSAIDLTGNIEGNTISGVTINNLTGTTINLSNSGNRALNITGDIVQTGSFYTSGDIVLRGNINIGDNLTGDTLTLNSEISSSMIPDSNNNFDLGTSSKFWRNLYVSGTAFVKTLEANQVNFTDLGILEDLSVSGSTYLGNGGDVLVVSGSIYNDQLTQKRLVVVGADGLLTNYSGLTFDNGNLNLSGALEVTNIQGTGSLYLKPNLNDGRDFRIYNTAPSDIHIKGNASYSFFGDDTNYLKIDDGAQTVTIVGVNGVAISSSLSVTGSAILTNNLNVSGDTTTIGSEYVNTNLFVGGNGKVTGSFEVVSATSLDSTLTVTGSATFKSTLNVTGATTIDGLTTINDNAVVNGVLTVTGNTQLQSNLYVSGNLEVLGSSTNVTIQSQTVEIDDNIIRMNAYSPFLRYAGFEVMDSGSSGVSSSMLWDSQNDYWLLTNQDGSGSKFIGTTFGAQGTEVSLTSGTVPKATSANTIGDSLLTENGTTLSYNTNKFQVTASDGATLIAGNVTVSAGGGADAGTKTSAVVFRNSSNVLGYVSTTETTDVLDGILGYKNSDGALKFSTVIDGGTY
jgi:hypothetical protein